MLPGADQRLDLGLEAVHEGLVALARGGAAEARMDGGGPPASRQEDRGGVGADAVNDGQRLARQRLGRAAADENGVLDPMMGDVAADSLAVLRGVRTQLEGQADDAEVRVAALKPHERLREVITVRAPGPEHHEEPGGLGGQELAEGLGLTVHVGEGQLLEVLTLGPAGQLEVVGEPGLVVAGGGPGRVEGVP